MTVEIQHLLRQQEYEKALERMLDLYEQKVFRMAVMILRDHGRAEEVTQDVFLKLWQVLPAYDGRAALSTLLYTIARNTCLSVLRAESYRKVEALDASNEPTIRPSDGINIDLERQLAMLPEVQREVISLYYLQERSVDDVAEMLDIPAGTVKSYLHRARRALGERMR